ncbi:MAG TPA: hypothetical protein VFC65_08450 [Prolixibacteraceae bacterium]|nr:hypothetical protein [Prolixibacteraceae bacterium]
MKKQYTLRKFIFAATLAFLLMLLYYPLFAQESKVSLNGYVKELYMFYSPENPIPGTDRNNLTSNILHNRLNFKWYTSKKLTTVIEMRNRLMFGSLVKDFPGYQTSVNVDNGLVNMSWIPAQGSGWFMHSMIDRAYLDYSSGKWQVRLGRQRVNWGVNLVWNPNDIFNTFSYFDFDYEERPGTDAVRVQYYTGTTSSAELVYKPGHDNAHTAIAGMYKFTQWNYDFQFLGGQAGNDWVVAGQAIFTGQDFAVKSLILNHEMIIQFVQLLLPFRPITPLKTACTFTPVFCTPATEKQRTPVA